MVIDHDFEEFLSFFGIFIIGAHFIVYLQKISLFNSFKQY